jgi:hypothetical protein
MAGSKKDPQHRDTRRRFEQWARNPVCEANTISAVYGIPMAEVAKREGLRPTMGQSPFAIARGQTFERGLFRDAAAELREELERAEVLPVGSSGFVDFRMRVTGGPMADLDRGREATLALLRRIGGPDERDRPSIIASATLLIPSGVMLPEALLVIDVLAVRYAKERVTLTVGEIKTYPDRGGHTDTEELASARAQAGVYVHALRMVIDELGLGARISVEDQGFLVLSRPGFNRPSVRPREELKYQAWRAVRGFAQLENAAELLAPLGDAAFGEKGIEAVRDADKSYFETCVGFCDLAPKCFARSLESNDPVILGEEVARFLGDIPLDRALELMNGKRPKNEAEEDLGRRLRMEVA